MPVRHRVAVTAATDGQLNQRTERQQANPDPVLVEHHHSTPGQVDSHSFKIGQEKRSNLVSAATLLTAEQHHRWLRSVRRRQKITEVRVTRNNNQVLVHSERHQLRVRRATQTNVANVNHIVAGRDQRLFDPMRLVLVQKKLHAGRRRGSSRSCSAKAAYRRASAISADSRSGCSAKISSFDIPSATIATTDATGKRSSRIHATPPIRSGSTVIRSNVTPSAYARGAETPRS